MAERLYSLRQVSDLLGIPPATVSGWVERRHLAAERTPGDEVRVSEAALVQFLRERGINLEAIAAKVSRRETVETGAAEPADAARQLVDAILSDAAERGAAAVVLQPQADGLALQLRIGGRLFEKPNFKRRLPEELRAELLAHVKRLAGTNGPCSISVGGRQLNLLVSTCPADHGESVTIHIRNGARG